MVTKLGGTQMVQALLRFCLGLSLVAGLAGSVQGAPLRPLAPVHLPDTAVIQAEDTALGGMNEIFHMDAPRLVFLGAGIVTGAVLIAPGLGVNELLGVVLGVIGSEFLYHTVYEPSFRSSHWF